MMGNRLDRVKSSISPRPCSGSLLNPSISTSNTALQSLKVVPEPWSTSIEDGCGAAIPDPSSSTSISREPRRKSCFTLLSVVVDLMTQRMAVMLHNASGFRNCSVANVVETRDLKWANCSASIRSISSTTSLFRMG